MSDFGDCPNFRIVKKYLAYLIDKFKNKNNAPRPNIKPYKDALKIIESSENEAYNNYLKLLKDEIIRYDVQWKVEMEKLKSKEAYNTFLRPVYN